MQADLERILAIWNDCRRQNAGGGPFLFGPFTIADAMFAPVCSRLVTYAVPVHGVAATCWHPQLKGLVLQQNGIYNNWRFEDVWLAK